MAEETVYANVAVLVEENKGRFQVKEVPQRRSNVTVKRVALAVLSLLLLAVVSALIGVISVLDRLLLYYNSPSKSTSEAMTEMTTVAVDFTEIQTTPGHTTAAVQTCPSHTYLCDMNWTLAGTKCYYISSKTTKVPWAGASAMCQEMGVDLVKIESREEQVFLFNTIESDWFWIGLTDSQTEGDWRWTDGSSLNKNLTFWNKEPDDWKGPKNDHSEGEDCAIILKESTKEESWSDVFCSLRNRFICEKEASCQH